MIRISEEQNLPTSDTLQDLNFNNQQFLAKSAIKKKENKRISILPSHHHQYNSKLMT